MLENLLELYIEKAQDQSLLFHNGAMFEGDICNNNLKGSGRFSTKSFEYQGDFGENNINGEGTIKWKGGTYYIGQVKQGFRNGPGKYFGQYIKIEANWNNGNLFQKGKLEFNNGNTYIGEWKDNKQNGRGVMIYPNGDEYEGEWKDNKRHGFGKMKWKSINELYEGEWENGLPHGKGIYIWKSNHKRLPNRFPYHDFYIGNWFEGKRNGFGELKYSTGAIYKGDWKDNFKYGEGVYVAENGQIFKGFWKNDHFNGQSISHLLFSSFWFDLSKFILPEQSEERCLAQINVVIKRHYNLLQKIYCKCAVEDGNSNAMTRFTLWKLLEMCDLRNKDLNLAFLNRSVGEIYKYHPVFKSRFDVTLHVNFQNLHDPNEKLNFRDFIEYVIHASNLIYDDGLMEDSFDNGISNTLNKILKEDLSKFQSKNIEIRDQKLSNVEKFRPFFNSISKKLNDLPNENIVYVRDLVFKLKEKEIFYKVTTKEVLNVLAKMFPYIFREGEYNLSHPMLFEELVQFITILCEQIGIDINLFIFDDK